MLSFPRSEILIPPFVQDSVLTLLVVRLYSGSAALALVLLRSASMVSRTFSSVMMFIRTISGRNPPPPTASSHSWWCIM